MENYRREVSGKLIQSCSNVDWEKTTFCSSAAWHYLEQRLRVGSGVNFRDTASDRWKPRGCLVKYFSTAFREVLCAMLEVTAHWTTSHPHSQCLAKPRFQHHHPDSWERTASGCQTYHLLISTLYIYFFVAFKARFMHIMFGASGG